MVSNEVDVGYKVTVSKMFEASGVADESGEFFAYPEPDSYVKANTQYLVTLDVNGVNKLYRELWTSGDFDDNTNVALSDYTYIMDEQIIADLSEGDEVVVRFEEVEVKTSDAFRAAVKKVAPAASGSSEGGGSGTGGVLVVTEDENGTLDKTWQEIHDAALVGIVVLTCEYSSQIRPAYLYEVFVSDDEYQVAFRDSYYIASSADGYPIIHLGE